jgi:two-component system sensor histidine kinase HydH
MMGFAELLARRLHADPEQQEMAGRIVAGAQQLTLIVQRLLEFARDPKLERRPIEWTRFLHMAVDQYEENARQRGQRLRLVRRWPEQLPPGRVDALCLRQAIWNILENAEQAAGSDDVIEIIATPRPEGGIRLQVKDRGHGVDPCVLDRVFMPFVTTREKGTGLGLATAKKIVEAHGGQISLSNRIDGGVEVVIDLPSDPQMVGEARPTPMGASAR